ncbi:MAG TPA: PQQ-binding-like beta-propeller repeat protein [Fimbriiglobus sp.]|jgi:outer membrane protein assembly factor BamB
MKATRIRITAATGLAALIAAGCQPSPAAPAEKPTTPGTAADVPAAPILTETDLHTTPNDHVMFGGSPSRNMVDLHSTNIPEKPDPNDTSVLLWSANLGSVAYGGPTVGYGRVFAGTNNEQPRNKRDTVPNSDGGTDPIDRGVLMCFDEQTGKFLWQAVHPKLEGGAVRDWPKIGICSAPLLTDGRVYYVSNQCRLVCLDPRGYGDGTHGKPLKGTDRNNKPIDFNDPTDAALIWDVDLIKKFDVFPHNLAASSPMAVDGNVYFVTSNGVDEGHINIPSPEAPSFMCVNEKTGAVVWDKAYPGKSIMHGQWSSPSYGVFGGVKTVIFPGGDGWLYGLKPDTGDIIWKFDANPKGTIYELGGTGNKSDFIASPVIYDGRIYIGLGQDPEHFTGISHFWCIDPAGKTGDVSPELVDKVIPQPEGKPKVTGKPNPNSAVVWHYGGAETRPFMPRDFVFGRTISTACIVDGIVYVAELQGIIHCLDAKTGKKYWHYDVKGQIWGSPFYVDGKVYLTVETGDLFVFKHYKKPKVIDSFDQPGAKTEDDFRAGERKKRAEVEKEYLIDKVEFDAPIRSTPVVANGILFVMTENKLYAFKKKK